MTIQNVTFRGLITGEQYIIVMEYYVAVGTVLSCIGIISNIINIRTFIIMGLADGITVSFLALSSFDLSYLVVSFALTILVSFGIIELKYTTRFAIDPYGLGMIFANVMNLLNVTNVLTTTFLAVARCMCVAKPLTFKNTFSRKKTSGFIISFTFVAVVSYMPVLANMAMIEMWDKKTNISRPVLWLSKNRESVKVIVWLMFDMILPFTTQVIILICVIVMANSLRAASKFRQSLALKPRTNNNKSKSKNIPGRKSKRDNASTKHSDKMPDKEIRVVQQVVLISLVYAICNTPKILISIVAAVDPEFAPDNRLRNLYLIVNTLRKHFETFNAAINTVIYYKYNSKFRTTLLM